MTSRSRHQPPPTPPAPSAAAQALGIGAQPDKWSPAAIIQTLETRYTQLVQLADADRERGYHTRARLFYAGAYEHTALLASYYQDQGVESEYRRWEHRRQRLQIQAYRPHNATAESIGAGVAKDLVVPLEVPERETS